MANDRLFISCKECGEKIMFAKVWGGMTETTSDIEARMDRFLTDHVNGCGGTVARLEVLTEDGVLKSSNPSLRSDAGYEPTYCRT